MTRTTHWKEGDRIRVVDRAQTNSDAKTGLYYNYYRGLTGTIFKLYGDGDNAQAAIDVDIDSLPEAVAKRHLDTRDLMRSNFTSDARRSVGELDFRLRYVILIAVSDLARKAGHAAPLPATNGKSGKTLAA